MISESNCRSNLCLNSIGRLRTNESKTEMFLVTHFAANDARKACSASELNHFEIPEKLPLALQKTEEFVNKTITTFKH